MHSVMMAETGVKASTDFGIMLSRINPAARAFLLIAIAAAFAVTPMLFHGNAWGHDFDLHIPSWMEAEQQLRQGIVFPRWAAGANQGFGEPFFVFYPPLSRMIGATLGLLLPWKMVPGVYVWLVLVLAGAAMWKCAADWLQPPDAMIASLLYAANPYLLMTAYKRCNYAELLASALFPLLIWAGLRMGRDPSKTILPLSMAFAAMWLSDLPAAVVASYSLAALLLLNSVVYRSLRPVVYGGIGILAAFGAIAFFLFPAAWERKWVNIGEALRSEWMPEHNFLFAHNNLPQYVSFNRGLSLIAVLLVIAVAIAAVLADRLRRNTPDVWRSLTALGGISTFMMFPPSLILYRTLPEMRFVEFPWRWLSPLCVVAAFLTASATARFRRKWIVGLAVAFVIASIGAVIVHTSSWDSHHHLEDVIAATHSGAGYRSLASWCRPLGSQPSRLDKAVPLIASTDPEDQQQLSGQRSQIQVQQWLPERKVFSVDSPHPLILKVKLLTYPAWQAKLNGKLFPLETNQDTGQMLLSVPAGLSRIEIRYRRTWDCTLGAAVSLTTVLAFALLVWLLRERESISRASETRSSLGPREMFRLPDAAGFSKESKTKRLLPIKGLCQNRRYLLLRGFFIERAEAEVAE